MNDRDFSDALCWIANSPVISIDTETQGLHPHEYDRITGIGVANTHNAIYFPLRHPTGNLNYDQARNLVELLSQQRQRILFHNAIFDWPFLRNDGWTYPHPWRDTWDTLVCAWLLDENEPKKLEEQIAIHFGLAGERRAKEQKERQRRIKKIGWANVSYEDIQAYGAADARHTFDLYLWQRARISKDATLAVGLVREHRFLQVCDEMISHGVRVDTEQAQRKLAECDEGIDRLTGEYPGLNFDSPKQLGELLYGDDGWCIVPTSFTAHGQPSTDKDTLLRFLEYEPRIGDIFEYRKLRKARSTYYSPLCERIGRDERVHAWFRPHGTKPGRMSCSDPNLQTLPNPDTLPGIKECFVPEAGYSLLEYDLEQAELRVAAYYADDLVLRQHVESGDVHSATSQALFGHADGYYRKVGKTLNFACPAPETRVLTSDLRWMEAGALDVGDQLLAFDADVVSGVRRKWREAEVTHVGLASSAMKRITFSDGTVIEVTPDHPFLSTYLSRWQRAASLRPTSRINKLLDVRFPTSDSMWLGGFLDGEGHVPGARSAGLRIGFGQTVGTALEEAVRILKQLGIPYHEYVEPRTHLSVQELHQVYTARGWAALELLTQARTMRIQPNALRKILDLVAIQTKEYVTPVLIEDVPKGTKVQLSTSTGTYISEGLASHNCLYGIGAAKFVRTARRNGDQTMTEDQARQYLGQWRNLYAGVTKAMTDAQKVAEERGYVKLWPQGRYRRFDSGHCYDHPKDALNSIVQGGVGEYVKQLMMELREPAERAGVRVVLNVHDSLVCEVPSGMEEIWTKFVRKTAARINPFAISMPVGNKLWA